jgi:hypothetical protein
MIFSVCVCGTSSDHHWCSIPAAESAAMPERAALDMSPGRAGIGRTPHHHVSMTSDPLHCTWPGFYLHLSTYLLQEVPCAFSKMPVFRLLGSRFYRPCRVLMPSVSPNSHCSYSTESPTRPHEMAAGRPSQTICTRPFPDLSAVVRPTSIKHHYSFRN